MPYVPLDGYTSVPLMFPQLAGTFSCRIESPSAAMWVLLKATEQKVAEMVYLRMTEEAALNPGGRTLGGVLGVAIDPPATTVSAKDVQVEVEVEVANGEVL